MENKEVSTTYWGIAERFRDYNEQHGITYGGKHPEGVPCISAVIVYKQSNFDEPYTEAQRSYRVNNFSGKLFFNGMLGGSVFGNCLDGTDEMLRLDVQDWEIERCYFEVTA